jgi:beta-ureidopropionase / N-carbamoyl-L-amino-acid hydrolase
MSDVSAQTGSSRIAARLAALPEERVAFSGSDMRGRAVVAEMMAQAGMGVTIDDAFNVVGLSPGSSDRNPIIIGSHLDTVPSPGRFDGALGVLTAVECAETVLSEQRLKHPLMVVGFSDEEGSLTGGCWGARAMTGQLTEAETKHLRDESSSLAVTLSYAAHELHSYGWAIDPFAALDLPRANPCCYLELHIEQGPVLERQSVPTGAVTSIVGIDRYSVTFPGKSGHAGTVPMADRGNDAVIRAARFVTHYWEVIRAFGEAAVVNIGDVAVHPGSFNVIPDEVRLAVEVRSPDAALLNRLGQHLEDLSSQFQARPEAVSHDPPVVLDEQMRKSIIDAAQRCGIGCLEMPSWAGHDAAVFASVAPTGMIFVPSVDGASHCSREMTHESDIAAGLGLLLETVRALDGLLP